MDPDLLPPTSVEETQEDPKRSTRGGKDISDDEHKDGGGAADEITPAPEPGRVGKVDSEAPSSRDKSTASREVGGSEVEHKSVVEDDSVRESEILAQGVEDRVRGEDCASTDVDIGDDGDRDEVVGADGSPSSSSPATVDDPASPAGGNVMSPPDRETEASPSAIMTGGGRSKGNSSDDEGGGGGDAKDEDRVQKHAPSDGSTKADKGGDGVDESDDEAGGGAVVSRSSDEGAEDVANAAIRRKRSRAEWTFEEDKILRAAVEEFGAEEWWHLIAARLPGRTRGQCRQRWRSRSKEEDTFRRGEWTPYEDEIVIAAEARMGPSWKEIVDLLRRSKASIGSRWNRTLRDVATARKEGNGEDDGNDTAATSATADEARAAVDSFLESRAREPPRKEAPVAKKAGRFTMYEDELIIAAVTRLGPKWKVIAKLIGNSPKWKDFADLLDNSLSDTIRKRWNRKLGSVAAARRERRSGGLDPATADTAGKARAVVAAFLESRQEQQGEGEPVGNSLGENAAYSAAVGQGGGRRGQPGSELSWVSTQYAATPWMPASRAVPVVASRGYGGPCRSAYGSGHGSSGYGGPSYRGGYNVWQGRDRGPGGPGDEPSPGGYSPAQPGGAGSAPSSSTGLGCTCRKSRCLKLYCRCFASSSACDPSSCKCASCRNDPRFGEEVLKARETVLERNPKAFEGKFEFIAEEEEVRKDARDSLTTGGPRSGSGPRPGPGAWGAVPWADGAGPWGRASAGSAPVRNFGPMRGGQGAWPSWNGLPPNVAPFPHQNPRDYGGGGGEESRSSGKYRGHFHVATSLPQMWWNGRPAPPGFRWPCPPPHMCPGSQQMQMQWQRGQPRIPAPPPDVVANGSPPKARATEAATGETTALRPVSVADLPALNLSDLPSHVEPFPHRRPEAFQTKSGFFVGAMSSRRNGKNKYRSKLTQRGTNKYLGSYASEWEAGAMYAWAYELMFGEKEARKRREMGKKAAEEAGLTMPRRPNLPSSPKKTTKRSLDSSSDGESPSESAPRPASVSDLPDLRLSDLPRRINPIPYRHPGDFQTRSGFFRGARCVLSKKGKKRYESRIFHEGSPKQLGTFESEWEAGAMYAWAYELVFGEKDTRRQRVRGEQAAEKAGLTLPQRPDVPSNPRKMTKRSLDSSSDEESPPKKKIKKRKRTAPEDDPEPSSSDEESPLSKKMAKTKRRRKKDPTTKGKWGLSAIRFANLPGHIRPLPIYDFLDHRRGKSLGIYRGAYRIRQKRNQYQWQAQISTEGTSHSLGVYDTEYQAGAMHAWAYSLLNGTEKARIELHKGEVAAQKAGIPLPWEPLVLPSHLKGKSGSGDDGDGDAAADEATRRPPPAFVSRGRTSGAGPRARHGRRAPARKRQRKKPATAIPNAARNGSGAAEAKNQESSAENEADISSTNEAACTTEAGNGDVPLEMLPPAEVDGCLV